MKRDTWSSPRTRNTHTLCRAFGTGAVTTCFNDLGMSLLGFDHPTFCLLGERSYRLRHRRCHDILKTASCILVVKYTCGLMILWSCLPTVPLIATLWLLQVRKLYRHQTIRDIRYRPQWGGYWSRTFYQSIDCHSNLFLSYLQHFAFAQLLSA